MRVGFNPYKDEKLAQTEYNHQIIIPVCIPNKEGYFKESLKIFKICVQSLLNTIHSKSFVTIVNNGSCFEVIEYLNTLLTEKKIHELIHTDNVGKLNAVLKGVVGNEIELVTIADADVFFLNDWQSETVKVYNNFPKAGVVGIVPQFRNFSHLCGNIIFENFFSNKLKFTPVKNPEALDKFNSSICDNDNYNKAYLRWNLTIEKDAFQAIVGSGHFVATYKRALFSHLKTYLSFKLGGDSERYFDELPLKKGLWRMTSNDNYAYHMGNNFEEWMQETLDGMPANDVKQEFLLTYPEIKNSSKIDYFIKNRLFIKLFNKKRIRRFFYKIKGLPKHEINSY
jgi:hypothetical protein